MAYASNETGRMEIYVSSFPALNGKWQVSSAGGQEPRWRQNGMELFYLSANEKMMAVEVKAGASFETGSPVALFSDSPAAAGIDQAKAQIAAAEAGKEAVQAELIRARSERKRQRSLSESFDCSAEPRSRRRRGRKPVGPICQPGC